MIFLFFCICLIFSVAFHPPLMQSRAQPHLPAGNCHCAPSLSPPFLLSALPCPPLCFIHFCSVSVSVHFASSSARLLRFFLFFCCFPSIFPFFVCCAAVTFGHHHYHLPPSEPFCSPLPRPAHHHHHLWLLWPPLLQSECAFCASHFYCSLHTQLHFSPLLGGLFLWLHIARGPLTTSHPLAHPLPVPIC